MSNRFTQPKSIIPNARHPVEQKFPDADQHATLERKSESQNNSTIAPPPNRGTCCEFRSRKRARVRPSTNDIGTSIRTDSRKLVNGDHHVSIDPEIFQVFAHYEVGFFHDAALHLVDAAWADAGSCGLTSRGRL